MSIQMKYLDKKIAAIAALRDYDSMAAKTTEDAQQYLAWFKPAWNALNQEEKIVLRTIYCEKGKAEAINTLCDAFKLGRTEVYAKRDKVIRKLALLLYGY